ncbi:MAG: polymerase sigma factor FliA [Pseudomonadota bacterium]|jgi:RNA polymerase sigma factor for flagellar operon FliA
MTTTHKTGETAPVQAAALTAMCMAAPAAASAGTAPQRATMPTDAEIRPFVPLVRTLARQLRARLPASVEADDLMQAGLIGLAEAFGRYDARPGVRFQTFAAQRIRGAMLDQIRAVDWLSRGDRRQLRDLEGARHYLLLQLGRAPTERETAAEMGLPLADLQRLSDRSAGPWLVSFEDLPGQDGTDFLDHHAADAGHDQADAFEHNHRRQAVAAAIRHLPERQQQVLALMVGDGLTATEAAAVLGVTVSRVCQVHRQAIDQLRAVLGTSSTSNTERA